MDKNRKLKDRIKQRISRRKCVVFLREDFEDFGGYDQVGRCLRLLVREGALIKIGHGLYAKAKISPLTGTVVPVLALPSLAKEALNRLGFETGPSSFDIAYNSGKSTQVPTGRMIGITGRTSRRIGYNGTYVNYERIGPEKR